MKKHFKKTLQKLRLVAIPILVSFAFSGAWAQEKERFIENESKFKELVKEHERELFLKRDKKEANDQDLRIKNYRENQKQLNNKRLAGFETLANGTLQGEWIEKGATNVPGRIQNVDYYAPTAQVYAVSDGGNVWRGDLNGTSWTCLNNNLKLNRSNYIKVIANGSGKRIIVGTPDRYLYYSDNEGLNWHTASGLNDLLYWGWGIKTVVANDAANTVYLLAFETTWDYFVTIYRSVDKGTSFTKVKSWSVNLGNEDQNKFSLFTPTNTTHDAAYVINKDSIFRIPNTGVASGLFKHNLTFTNDVRFTGQKSGTTINMYLSNNGKIYSSTSLGQSWTQLNAPNANNTFGIHSFRVSDSNPNNLYFGDVEAYRGVRSGTNITWTKVNGWGDYYGDIANKLHADIPAFVPVNINGAEQILICTDGGLYKSTDGVVTVKNITMTGMNNSQYYSVYTNRNNTNYVYTGSQDQGFQQSTVSTPGLLNFNQIMSGDNGRFASTNSTSFWHTGYDGLFYFPSATSTSNFWYGINGLGRLWLPFILEHPTNPSIMYLAGGKTTAEPVAKIQQFTYVSGSGIQRTALSYDFAPSSGCNNLAAIAISKINNNYCYVLTDNGKFFSTTGGIGSSFSMNQSFLGPKGHYFYGSAIIASETTLGTVYIAGDNNTGVNVYKSTNHGASFTPIDNGMPETLIHDLAFNADESLVFAATDLGAYVYVVADNAWYPMIGNSGADQIYWDVEFIAAQNTVRFGSFGRGIWDFKIQSGNQNPTVSVTAPANNATFTAPATVNLAANAVDPDGTISKVEFYRGTTFIGDDFTSPYTYSWTNVAAGTYSITAKAYDNSTGITTSTPITIVVNGTSTNNLCVEAESASGQSTFSPFQTLSDANASGGTYISVPNGTGNQGSPPTNSIVTYNFNITTAGTYHLWIRLLTPTTSDNDLYARTDANSFSSWTPAATTSWTWVKWTTRTWNPGAHSLSLARKEDGVRIDKILITPSTTTPTGTGCGSAPAAANVVTSDEWNEADMAVNQLVVSPNPSQQSFSLISSNKAIAMISVSNVLGEEVFKTQHVSNMEKITFGNDFGIGIYTVVVQYEDGKSESIKILKTR